MIKNSCLTCEHRKKAYLGYINSQRKETVFICEKKVAKQGELVCNCLGYKARVNT